MSQELSWNDAWVKCKSKGGKLAVIGLQEDKKSILKAVINYYGGLTWQNLWKLMYPWECFFWNPERSTLYGTSCSRKRGFICQFIDR